MWILKKLCYDLGLREFTKSEEDILRENEDKYYHKIIAHRKKFADTDYYDQG
ncbi:MAG: hypothetical protein JEZ08_22445 [Clostridiales bacterium]|nr:hypothetical protein [Clostridiales bacterium]